MGNTKTILFDFDGVLVDSFRTCFNVSAMLEPGRFSEDDYLRLFEGNIHEEFSKIDKKSDKENVSDKDWDDMYIPKFLELSVIAGVPEMLATI